jgi:NTE family protein
VIARPDGILDHITFLIRLAGAFSDASDECIRSIAEVVSWITVPGGTTLFSQGEPSTSIYITSSGLLGAFIRNGAGEETLIRRIGRGEMIGEMGCVADEPRSATIRALRTSEVLMVSWEAFEPLARAHPILLLSLCRTVIGRLRGLAEGKRPQIALRTYCLLPQGNGPEIRTFIDDLVAEFSRLGPTFRVTKEACHDYTTDRLVALEASHDYVIYLADEGTTPWSRLCLQQADTVLIIGQGKDAPRPIEPFDNVSAGISTNLILLWPGKIIPGKTGPWLDNLRPRAHHHVRSSFDVGRVARLLTGKGLGIVLSGGGARGLAHVGVRRAFAEHGIAIDAVVGTSIGALVGASIAMEWDYLTSRARAHRFSRKHPFWELVFPLHSLFSGRNLRASLKKWYGETKIEETPIPYACVSASLNTSGAAVHLRGKLRTWVCASSSPPGIFPPVLEKGTLYIDGAVVNNLPTDTIRGMGVGFVVAVELGADDKALGPGLPSIIEVLMRVATMGSDARYQSAREQCDVLLSPNLLAVDLLDFRAYDLAMQIGYDCALEKIEQIKRRIPDKVAANVTSPALAVDLPPLSGG